MLSFLALRPLCPAESQEVEKREVVEGVALELRCVDGQNTIWTFNGSTITFEDGIACGGYCNLSDESLVIGAVLRQHQGIYTCLFAAVRYLVTVIG